jgi:hypothetical protein
MAERTIMFFKVAEATVIKILKRFLRMASRTIE